MELCVKTPRLCELVSCRTSYGASVITNAGHGPMGAAAAFHGLSGQHRQSRDCDAQRECLLASGSIKAATASAIVAVESAHRRLSCPRRSKTMHFWEIAKLPRSLDVMDQSTGFAGRALTVAACFAALLGGREHGRWLITTTDEAVRVSRRYRDDTLILETDFETADGAVTLVDFMPPRGKTSEVIRMIVGRRGQRRNANGVYSAV